MTSSVLGSLSGPLALIKVPKPVVEREEEEICADLTWVWLTYFPVVTTIVLGSLSDPLALIKVPKPVLE